MKKLNTQLLTGGIRLLNVAGFALCSGSIASFIAMNVITGDHPANEFTYWQRIFVDPIMYYVTVPGMWLLLVSTCVLHFQSKGKMKIWTMTLLLLASLIVINGQLIIIPYAIEVNELASLQMKSNVIIKELARMKGTEDTFGAVNFILLIAYLITNVFYQASSVRE